MSEPEDPLPLKEAGVGNGQRPLTRRGRRGQQPWQIARSRNKAIFYVRAALWILPLGFGIFSAGGISWLESRGYLGEWGVGVWLIVNLVFVFGVGWFEALLSNHACRGRNEVGEQVAMFFFMQIFVVPMVAIVFVMLAGFVISLFF